MKKLLSFVVAALLVAMPAPAQVHAQDMTADLDRIFGWATPTTPGCAVAVSQHGEPVVNARMPWRGIFPVGEPSGSPLTE